VAPHSTLSDFEWRTAAAYRLGLPHPCLAAACGHACGSDSSCSGHHDALGHHVMRCNHANHWFRHQALLHALASLADRAGLANHESSSERLHPELRAVLGNRQADLILPDFRGAGLDAHIDVTVVDPLLRAYGDMEYCTPGDAVRLVKAVQKYDHYSPITAFGHVVQVFGVELFGAIDPDAIAFLSSFIVRPFVSARGVDPDSERGRTMATAFREQCFARLSVAVQRANAHLVHATVVRIFPKTSTTQLGLVARFTSPSPPSRAKRKRARKQRRSQNRSLTARDTQPASFLLVRKKRGATPSTHAHASPPKRQRPAAHPTPSPDASMARQQRRRSILASHGQRRVTPTRPPVGPPKGPPPTPKEYATLVTT
jgi:hypothetical protein